MGKVVTSQGLQAFAESGKFETIANAVREAKADAPPLEVVKPPEAVDIDPNEDKEVYGDVDEETKAEVSKAKRFDNLMRKKHREMKQADAAAKLAREEAQEADRLAESQFNRARLAEQRLAEVEKQLEGQKAKPVVPEAKEPNESDPEYTENGQFNWRKFTRAQAEFAAKQAVAEYTTQQEQTRKAAEMAAIEAQAKVRIDAAKQAHPDYQAVLEKADVKTHNAVLQYLTTSEHIGEVSYYLAKNPEYVERINKLNPLKAIAEIGRLELTLEKPEPKAESAPSKVIPAPISPLSSQPGVNVNTDPSRMSYKELRAFERSRQKARN